MKRTFKAVNITPDVYWVGAIDWNIRDFHGYATKRGSTYNAYLIIADKVTLVDTVKAPFKDELLARIASVIEPEKIDYIISNHSEMDHSGCLSAIVERVKPEKVFASPMGVKNLAANLHHDFEVTPVKTGESLSLGNKTLDFIETKMLHWPDSMVSYLKEEEILFSQDAFGMHLASAERFDDELPESVLEWEARKYYANILLHLSPKVAKTMVDLKAMNLPLKLVATDHGPVWRQRIDWIFDLYEKWSKQEPTDRALIVYDTMWHSTATMASAIAEGVTSVGARVKVMQMGANHRSDIITDAIDSGAIIAGSPTLNNNLFPSMADALVYVKGLRPKNKIGAAFGSFGWSGEATKQIEEYLDDMGVERVADTIKVKYVPTGEDLERCFQMGQTIGEKLKANAS